MAKRPVSADDVRRFQWVYNPSVATSGEWVVFEQSVVNEKDDDYDIQLRIADINGSNLRTLTSSGSKNFGAAISPDGQKVAFVSNRAFGTQAWVLPMAGGEPRQLTRFKRGIGSLVWSPDGKTLFGLVSSPRGEDVEVYPTDVTSSEAKDAAKQMDEDFAGNPKHYDWMYYKGDGAGLSKGLRAQLVAVDVETGEFRQLTRGNYSVSSPAVSPDGKYVAFISNRRDNPELDWWYSDVYRVSVHGGELELLSDRILGGALAYSPDGRQIAVLGQGDEFYTYWSATHEHLFLLPADGGEAVKLTKDFPDTVAHTNLTDMGRNARTQLPEWSSDGRYVYVLSTREGRSEVVRFAADGSLSNGEVVIGGDRDVFAFARVNDDKFVIAYGTPVDPGRIVAVDIQGVRAQGRKFRAVTESMLEQSVPFFPAEEIRLDNSNQDLLEELDLVVPEPFWYRSEDNWVVQGWVMKPVQYQPGKQYPVLLEIHGGPQLNYGYSMFHEMQWFASQGYAVVFTNPRGGMSYGQEFVNGVRHNYGRNDAADVMNGLDAALQRFDFLDRSRVAVTGGSYGGFMTNWLVGHTDRFFAAVTQRSISNWISFYGVSDIGPFFCESQHGLTLADFEELWKISPLAYAENVSTPLLLIHSEHDLRCPMEQAEQFYTALKRLGKEAELFRVPNASHGLSRNGKPKLRIARLNAMFKFIHDRLPETL